MNPSSLLNVSPDLMREHVDRGVHEAPMACTSDRAWSLWVCVALTALAGLLIVVLH